MLSAWSVSPRQTLVPHPPLPGHSIAFVPPALLPRHRVSEEEITVHGHMSVLFLTTSSTKETD